MSEMEMAAGPEGLIGDEGMGVDLEGDPAAAAGEDGEMFEGGGMEFDSLPIGISRENAQQLVDAGEVEVNVQLEEEMVDIRLFIDDAELDELEGDVAGEEDLIDTELPEGGVDGEIGLDEEGVL